MTSVATMEVAEGVGPLGGMVAPTDRRARRPGNQRPQRRSTGLLSAVVVAAIALVASACTVDPPPANGDPPLPTISSFTATASSSSSPTTVTLAWTIKNLGSATATCLIESDEQGSAPIEVAPCAKSGSTTIDVVTDDQPRTDTFTLTVEVSAGYVLTRTTTFTVTPAAEEPFEITLGGLDALPSTLSNAVTQAAARWESVITQGFPATTTFPSWCTSTPEFPLPTSVDDLMIQVVVKDLDGVGGALAAAGPSCILLTGERAVTGIIYVDQADLAGTSQETLELIAAHEIGHVLGIGTLWNNADWGTRHLLDGEGTSDPRYTGVNGVTEWWALGGTGGIPVEATGGSGTANAHWRESVFENELMTGWIGASAPLSRMTVASLVDLGYTVDLGAADPYVLPQNMAGVQADAFGRLSASSELDADHHRFAPVPMTPSVDRD